MGLNITVKPAQCLLELTYTVQAQAPNRPLLAGLLAYFHASQTVTKAVLLLLSYRLHHLH
jgi:hypothetical protein